MSKESLHSIVGLNCVFRETFNSPLITARNGGIATDVSFLNGIGTFNGSTSKIDYGRVVRGVKSVRIIATLNSTTEDILNLSASHSIEATTGTLTATGFSSPTIYVDNVATDTITAGKHEIVVVTATAIEANDIIVGFVSAYFQDTIELIEYFNETLTVEEISLLYKGQLHAGLITDELIGYWDFMRGTAHDWSENGNDGIIYGAVYKHNEGLWFDGVNDYVDLGSSITYLLDSAAWSVSLWFNPTTYAGFLGLIQLKTDTGEGWSIFLSDNASYDMIAIGNQATFVRGSAESIPTTTLLNRWHHLVIVFDGVDPLSLSSFALYYDNNIYALTATGAYGARLNKSYIGTMDTGTLSEFKGQIFDVRIFNRAFTPEEITQEYYYGKRLLNP